MLEATSKARKPKLYVVQSKSALEGALLRIDIKHQRPFGPPVFYVWLCADNFF